MDLVLAPLRPALLDDWLAFFEGEAFADNPSWVPATAAVSSSRGRLRAWDHACESGANRSVMIEKIRAGEVDGLLAYRGTRVVGWIHYGPTARFHSPVAALSPSDDDVASIVCFVVAPSERRKGVARELLRGAVAALQRAGFRAVDARRESATTPPPTTSSARPTSTSPRASRSSSAGPSACAYGAPSGLASRARGGRWGAPRAPSDGRSAFRRGRLARPGTLRASGPRVSGDRLIPSPHLRAAGHGDRRGAVHSCTCPVTLAVSLPVPGSRMRALHPAAHR